MFKRPTLSPSRIAMIYIFFGLLWIIVTDYMAINWMDDPEMINRFHSFKGWLYVFLTGCLIYILVNTTLKKLAESEAIAQQHCQELMTLHKSYLVLEEKSRVFESLLLATNQRILKQEPLDQTLGQLCQELVDSLDNLWAMIAYKEPDYQVSFKYMAGIDPELKDSIVARWDDSPLGSGVVGMAIKTGETQIMECDERHYSIWPFLRSMNAVSLSAFPLKDYNETFGALVLISDRSHFSDPLLVTKFENFAHQVAIAMTFAKSRSDLAYQVYHDPLTGLPNRRLFNDRLRLSLAQANRKNNLVAVLFLDVDRFKLVNDTLGHATGDQLLKKISERLQSILREGDTLARQGGDEFLIILPEIQSKHEAGIVAKRLLDTLLSPFILDDHEVFVSGSIGISIYPTDGDSVETLVKNADSAMYYAKDQGRNNYQFFTKQLNLSAYQRLTLHNHLRRALEQSEFEVHYQPQVDLTTGEITGSEALIRWNSPSLGMVSPAQFIPIAEESGLIIPIGEWMLYQACRTNKSWQDSGYPPKRISINLSARQFYQKDLVQVIATMLKETGHPPELLELEITESIAMENLEFTGKILSQIKEMGISIAIDDFGMGFSSLNYLRRLPLDAIKIDQAFIHDIHPSHNGREIVNAIINLAHTLKLRVVAEGVETREQLAYLRTRGCDEMQGYLFSKALPAPEMAALLAQNKHLVFYSYLVK